MKNEIRRAARQFLVLLTVLLCSLLLVTCLDGDESNDCTRDYDFNRNTQQKK